MHVRWCVTGAQSILTTTREGVLKLRVMLTRADDSISLLEMGGSTDRQVRETDPIPFPPAQSNEEDNFATSDTP